MEWRESGRRKEYNVEMREWGISVVCPKKMKLFHFLGSFVCCFPDDKDERKREENERMTKDIFSVC